MRYLSQLMTLGLLCVTCSVSRALAEVGRDCSEGEMSCAPGEVCVADGQREGGRICTRPCSAVSPCPEGYPCESRGGVSLCLPSSARAQAGEACAQLACEEGLMCVQGDVGLICAQRCEGGGTCPRGFECRLGQEEGGFCLIEGALAGIGEPCDERMCTEGLSCLTPLGERSLRYCSAPCVDDEACPVQMGCDAAVGACRHPAPTDRPIGADCLLEYADERAAGCGQGLICEPSAPYPLVRVQYRGQGWCTQECGPSAPCPDGYGCDYTQGREPAPPGVGVCQQGVIDAPALSALQGPTGGADGEYVNLTPPSSEELESPGPGRAEGGVSCQAGGRRGAPWGLLLLLTSTLMTHRRRAQRSQGLRRVPLSL